MITKFANLRTFFGYMMAHPGKKLLFMGQEFGQFTEWSEEKQLDWMLLGYDKHTELQTYVKTLNAFYKEHPAFWQIDYSWEGFQWIVPDDFQRNVVAFLRKDAAGKQISWSATSTPSCARATPSAHRCPAPTRKC